MNSAALFTFNTFYKANKRIIGNSKNDEIKEVLIIEFWRMIVEIFLCCPSFIKKVALSDISRIPTSGYSSENEVKSVFPSTEPEIKHFGNT